MFERFVEKARRTVFRARYEATILGSSFIEAEHLLLALLQEDTLLLGRLPAEAAQDIRAQIEMLMPLVHLPVATIVDIPLSAASQQALFYSVEEADKLGHRSIDCCHLTLGLLRIDNRAVGRLLQKYGIGVQSYRQIILVQSTSILERLPRTQLPEAPQPTGAWAADSIAALENLVGRTSSHLRRYADSYGDQMLPRKAWTRKQALGHLVDCAALHQEWFARALTESKLVAGGYPPDGWVTEQKYATYVWQEIVDLWVSLNGLLIHVIAQIPEHQRELPCSIGSQDPCSRRSGAAAGCCSRQWRRVGWRRFCMAFR